MRRCALRSQNRFVPSKPSRRNHDTYLNWWSYRRVSPSLHQLSRMSDRSLKNAAMARHRLQIPQSTQVPRFRKVGGKLLPAVVRRDRSSQLHSFLGVDLEVSASRVDLRHAENLEDSTAIAKSLGRNWPGLRTDRSGANYNPVRYAGASSCPLDRFTTFACFNLRPEASNLGPAHGEPASSILVRSRLFQDQVSTESDRTDHEFPPSLKER